MDTIALFWFRRDLRLDDNVGFYHAIKNERKVLPIFIFDSAILNHLPKKDARVCFLHQRIEELNQHLAESNKKIHVYYGKPIDVLRKILSSNSIHAVYTNRDYEPYATQRDAEVKALLSENDVTFSTYKDHVIFERDEVVKSDGTPYRVYTPYSRVWLSKFDGQEHLNSHRIDGFEKLTTLPGHNNPALTDIGFTTSKITAPQYNTSDEIIDQYEARRNTPAVAGTSKVGIHLRFGTLSIRKAVAKALESTNQTFLKELIWREFFMQILWHFPHTENKSFKPQYDRIDWRNDPDEFKRWCDGETGYPFVDAGMRELNETGFMHNRVRMLVGSFLCKHLLIDWRLGEAYFAEKLLDYEMASNVGNWQWVAGCGVDAAPYFRIFNPTEQIKKFDKNHAYIKKWVPDYQASSYRKPIVDHKLARERCLETYKSALNK
ncbi:MAG: deoxyribodipyrimidine photo-lyase [Flavobacteriaceae bacterium]|nr:deoxyribodipyrimidine photo-lyase [Flavobacteriaceae bacterium]